MSYYRRSRDWFHFYSGSFRKGAHQLLAWGYEDARSKIRADHEEEEITGFIVTAIRKRLYDDPTTPPRFRIHYDIHEEQRDWKSEKTGKRRPKQLRKINVVKSLPDEWISVHSRKNNVNIEIFHILLDCT